MFKLSDFDYDLPAELIAQYPCRRRDSSRLLVLDRRRQTIRHKRFNDIVDVLASGDVLVCNDTKVMPARLIGRRATGGKVEILLLRELEAGRYKALINPLGRLKVGEEIFFDGGCSAHLVDAKNKIIAFKKEEAEVVMKKSGQIPLPPYIRRTPEKSDLKRYQTVFARKAGAVAAPTAGLHFTKNLLARLKKKGVRVVFLTLHVNYATFSPVRSLDIREHHLEEEYFEIPKATMLEIRRAKKAGGRIFSVGTTVCKALEDSHAFLTGDRLPQGAIKRWSRLFIYPPFSFKVVDALITNFHLPQTTLLMLISAFAGRNFVLDSYRQAIKEKYRFFSYGDATLIL